MLLQAPPITNCKAKIILYDIAVMDQYSPAIITVPANMSSVEISQFPDNGTSIVANREYSIIVSAISDQGRSYPSDPVTISKFLCPYIHSYIHTYALQRLKFNYIITTATYIQLS